MRSLVNYLHKEPTLYTFVWCLYYLQGTLYAEGSIVSRFLLVLFIGLSLFYALKLMPMKTNKYIKSFAALALMFGFYGILRVIFGDDGSWIHSNDPTTYFKEYELSILPVFVFYYFTVTDKIDEDWFYKSVFAFLIVAIALFYREETSRLVNTWREEVTNNTGYKFMALLPCVLFLKRKPIVQFAFLAIVLIFIIQGMKRGAILISAISLIFLLPNMLKSVRGKQRALVLLLVAAILVAVFYYIVDVMMNSDYFMIRVEETLNGNASNREVMYPMYYNFFIRQNNVINYLFGNGADGTLRYLGDFAHNDWLEVLINHGLVGVVIYAIYWMNAARYMMFSRKQIPTEITSILTITIIAYFIKSLFSMSINDMPLFTTSVLGYAIAKKDLILKTL